MKKNKIPIVQEDEEINDPYFSKGYWGDPNARSKNLVQTQVKKPVQLPQADIYREDPNKIYKYTDPANNPYRMPISRQDAENMIANNQLYLKPPSTLEEDYRTIKDIINTAGIGFYPAAVVGSIMNAAEGNYRDAAIGLLPGLGRAGKHGKLWGKIYTSAMKAGAPHKIAYPAKHILKGIASGLATGAQAVDIYNDNPYEIFHEENKKLGGEANWLDQYDEGGPTGKEKETKSTSQEDSVDKVNRIKAKLDQEQQRVKGVRANLIPSAQALDKADSELPMKDPNAYRIFEESKGARTPEELRKYISNYPQSLKNVLPVGGNYNIAQWQKDINDWDPQKYPGRELYCTPYGCFVYQKAGAKDVPNVGGNYGFVGGVEKGELPFREISPDKAQPGDMAIIYGDSPVDYTNPKKGRAIRPHHTSMYAGNMQKDSKGNITSFDMYNAHEGQRLNFKKEKRDKALDKDSFYKLYEYVGQTPQIEKELQEAYSELIRSNEMAPRQLSFPQEEPEIQPSSYLQSLPSQEYGGWLDELDEYKRGGQKGLRKFTSKNIQSSINTLFARNYDLFGPSGKKYYSPLVKYFDGGFNAGNALPGATQSTDWSMMANPNAVDYRTQAYPNASNPTMMQGPAAPTVTDKLTPEMGFDYKQKFDNPLFGGGKLANLTRGLMPWVTQLGMQDEYKAMQDKAFASTSANAVFRKDDQKNLGSYTPDTYGINNFRPNQVGMTVFGQGLAYENQNIGRYGGESGWLDNY